MKAKNTVRRSGFKVFLIVLFMVFTGHVSVLNAEWFKKLSEARKQAIREDIQDAIREAEKLSNEGKYAGALRLLFDAMYKEERTQLLILLDTDEKFPITAAHEITKLEEFLIHEDQSPLMQLFRNPDFPLQEKLAYVSELRILAAKRVRDGEEVLFRGKYRGTLVQLMTSRKLNRPEKFDVLYWIQSTIQREYTSAAQREQIQEEIKQLETLADQKLREHDYMEMFLLLSEAKQKLRDGLLYAQDRTTYKQVDRSVESYVQSDESSLMKLFKNPGISATERENVLTELKALAKRSRTATDKVLLLGKAYDGPLVQIMSNPKVSWLIKLDILRQIERQILKEIAQLPALADQKFREQHYLEAFVLLSEAAEQKADDISLLRTIFEGYSADVILLNPEEPLRVQILQGIELFIQSDTSPLIELLKNPEISVTEKDNILSGLGGLTLPSEHTLPVTDNVFVREEYDDDPLVQIISNSNINTSIKIFILGHIEETIEK